MHDFFCTEAKDMYYDVLAERVSYFKDAKEGSDIMCRAMEEIREKARQEGQQEGEWKNGLRVARRMLAAGRYALDEIMEITGLPLEDIQQLRNAMPR